MNENSLDQQSYDLVIVGGGPAAFGIINALREKSQTPLRILVLEQSDHFEGSGDASMKHFRTYQMHKKLAENVQETVTWYKDLAKQFPEETSTIYSFPYLYIAQTQDRLDMYRQNLAKIQGFGFGQDATILDSVEVSRRYPFIDQANNFLGGLLYPEAGWINLTRGFQKIMQDNPGVTFSLNTKLERIITEGDKVVGIATEKGETKVSKVVFAGGAFSLKLNELLQGAQCDLPMPITDLIHVQKAQSYVANLHMTPAETKLFLVNQGGAYVRINEDRAMYGYSDASSPLVEDPDVYPTSDNQAFSNQVFSQLGTLVSAYGTTENHGPLWGDPNSFKAGYIVETPDKLPIVSSTNISGFYLCTGLGHIGVMIHIGIGRMMADVILDKDGIVNPFTLFRQYT